MEKWKNRIRKLLKFLLNPRFVVCFGIAWFFTNGWSYVMMGLGAFFHIPWMMAVAGAYLTYLWLPISPEKLVTFALSIVLLKWLFPNDQETLAVLISMRKKLLDTLKRKKAEHDAKK